MCRLGDNELRSEGAKHVANMLAVNQTLTSVEYAMPCSPTLALHERQQPPTSLLTACVSVRFHDSLELNNLTNDGEDMSGIIQLAEALKTNEGLTSLEYARPPQLSLFGKCQ